MQVRVASITPTATRDTSQTITQHYTIIHIYFIIKTHSPKRTTHVILQVRRQSLVAKYERQHHAPNLARSTVSLVIACVGVGILRLNNEPPVSLP